MEKSTTSLKKSITAKKIAPISTLPRDSSHYISSLQHLNSPSPQSNSSNNNNTNLFPETDEIKTPTSNTMNFSLSVALKFQKNSISNSTPKIPKIHTNQLPTKKRKNSFSPKSPLKLKEIFNKIDLKSLMGQPPIKTNSKQKLALSLKQFESTDSFHDENLLIRKLKKFPKTKEDAKYIYNYIKLLPFFSRFQEQSLQNSVDEAILHICRYCEYEKYPKNTIIFKENDQSNDKFYVIISGTVNIYLQNSSIFMQENSNNETHTSSIITNTLRRKSSLFSAPKLSHAFSNRKKGSVMTPRMFVHHFPKHSFEESPVAKPRLLDENLVNTIGSKRNELGPGEAFGEKALLASDPELAKRTATIVAGSEVEFLVIHKMEFDRILQRFSKQNEAKIEFLNKVLPFLSSIRSVSTLENLIYSFKEERIGINMSVVSEDSYDNNEKIYFLDKGLCRVQKQMSFLINGIAHTTVCKLCDLAEGAIVGEEIIFQKQKENEQSCYKYTVVVLSEQACFYVINKSNFLLKFPKEIRSFLLEQFRTKEKARKELFIKNSQEIIKKYQEEQLQILIETNFIKNRDLLKNMSFNMKRNYIEKVRGLAEELTKDVLRPFDSKKSANIEKIDEEPFSIIEKLRTKARFKEMKKTLNIKNEALQEMLLQTPEEVEEFFEKNNQQYLIRNNVSNGFRKTTDNWKKNTECIENYGLNDKNMEFQSAKLDFGTSLEEEKLERMRRVKLGLIKPANPKISHYSLIEHMKFAQKKRGLRRLNSFDKSDSGVQIINTLTRSPQEFWKKNSSDHQILTEKKDFNDNNGDFYYINDTPIPLSERIGDKRASTSIKKGRTLGKFEFKKDQINVELGLGKGVGNELKEKNYSFYQSLIEKSSNLEKLFFRKKKNKAHQYIHDDE